MSASARVIPRRPEQPPVLAVGRARHLIGAVVGGAIGGPLADRVPETKDTQLINPQVCGQPGLSVSLS